MQSYVNKLKVSISCVTYPKNLNIKLKQLYLYLKLHKLRK
jgi:hypothetical protein